MIKITTENDNNVHISHIKNNDMMTKPKDKESPLKKTNTKKKEKKSSLQTSKKQRVVYKASAYVTFKVEKKGNKPGATVYILDYYYKEYRNRYKVVWIVEDYNDSSKTWEEFQDHIIME